MASVRTALALLGAARSVVSRAVAAQADSLLAAPGPVAPPAAGQRSHSRSRSTPWPSQQVNVPMEQQQHINQDAIAQDAVPPAVAPTLTQPPEEQINAYIQHSPSSHPPEPAVLQPDVNADEYDAATAPRAVPLRAARVPSSRIARALHYGGLGAGLAWGAAGSIFSGSQGSAAVLGEANLRRLVDKLSTMRGAALKMGQFLSIQGE